MAIDTQNKRRSALRSVRPVSDGTIDATDRRHALGIYRFADAVAIVYETGTLKPRFSIVILPGQASTATLRPRASTSQLRSEP